MSERGRRMSQKRENAVSVVVGGGFGVSAGFALRGLADVVDGREVSVIGEPGTTAAKWTRPSVVYGLGGGSMSLLLYLAEMGSPSIRRMLLGNGLAAVSIGVFSLLAPKRATSPVITTECGSCGS